MLCLGSVREIDDPDNWAIVYTHNRDSGLLAQSNAAVIADALRPFSETENPDVVFESHSHWAVGHVDGFSIRVYRDGEITDAFRTYHGLMERLDAYPILDEAITAAGNTKRLSRTSRTPPGASSPVRLA